MDLQTQLSNFKSMEKQLRQKLGASEVKALLSTAVYMFSIGSNDYLIPFITNSSVSILILLRKSVCQDGYWQHNKRDPSCPPISRALKIVSSGGSGCMEEITVLAKLLSRALPQALNELKSQLKGYTYSIFDAYTVAAAIFNNPSKYGEDSNLLTQALNLEENYIRILSC
ncbi:hypothetical protein SADUNF_Sadunf17G0124000 [Salix dunnii]|uniref:GDSL esterase/lipase n=1 Tax=Salix dunnii TaxID=1413687 RepID=A0A835J815_9ROSI|nr:hypothetical protein SADUNF_Sadunf17G0124000 [Salix dunnii]